MLYRRSTRTSVVIMSDEDIAKQAIVKAAQELNGAYEQKLVEETFVTAVEFYFGNVPQAERSTFIKEVFNMFDRGLKFLGKL
ncbi:MAG: hypothetical protein VST71_06675 [Nitrospirota bacterium]|nr:hypothetical protein [Nitrospirota bacterium]